MGFSGQNGGPALADLLIKLKSKEYYQVLFRKAYNNTDITEAKLQECLYSLRSTSVGFVRMVFSACTLIKHSVTDKIAKNPSAKISQGISIR